MKFDFCFHHQVAETCQLALGRLEWQKQDGDEKDLLPNPYSSVDPAPPAPTADISSLRLFSCFSLFQYPN